jgi:hypothetical protein
MFFFSSINRINSRPLDGSLRDRESVNSIEDSSVRNSQSGTLDNSNNRPSSRNNYTYNSNSISQGNEVGAAHHPHHHQNHLNNNNNTYNHHYHSNNLHSNSTTATNIKNSSLNSQSINSLNPLNSTRKNNANNNNTNNNPNSIYAQSRLNSVASSIIGSTDTINKRETLHSRFDFVKVLGKGTYGKVKLANDKRTGKQVI